MAWNIDIVNPDYEQVEEVGGDVAVYCNITNVEDGKKPDEVRAKVFDEGFGPGPAPPADPAQSTELTFVAGTTYEFEGDVPIPGTHECGNTYSSLSRLQLAVWAKRTGATPNPWLALRTQPIRGYCGDPDHFFQAAALSTKDGKAKTSKRASSARTARGKKA